MPYLPNEAAQRATNYGWMNPTHRRSHHTILVNLLQNPWYGILCPIGKSSVKVSKNAGPLSAVGARIFSTLKGSIYHSNTSNIVYYKQQHFHKLGKKILQAFHITCIEL